MASGGSRNRSGPGADERSGRSEVRGFKLTALPSEGYTGPVPEWPLPTHVDVIVEDASDRTFKVAQDFDDREAELWAWAWRTPQACAWSLPSEAWRAQTVARWVRQAVLCESPGAKAADHGQLHRYADQIGLTTAGLREMGWKVAVDELAQKAAAKASGAEAAQAGPKRERRLRSASGDAQ